MLRLILAAFAFLTGSVVTQTAAHWHRGYHISSAGRGKYWGSLMLGPDSAANLAMVSRSSLWNSAVTS